MSVLVYLLAIIQLLMSVPKLGVFEPGWELEKIEGVAYQQTYVGACADAYVLPHRLEQMYGNKPFIYIENSTHPLSDLLSGSLDACWREILGQVPDGEIVAPIAEANGPWTSYHGSAEEVARAYAHLRSLDPGDHRWCGSFTLMGNTHKYMDAVREYVDVWCPSAYDWDGTRDVAESVRLHLDPEIPTILAQTGTVRTDKEAWIWELRKALAGKVEAVIYFNHLDYAFDWRQR